MKGEIPSGIDGINIETGKKEQQKHNRIIAIIVRALRKAGFEEINFDHIVLGFPKANIPLQLDKRRYDIAVKIGKNEYAYIEIMHIYTWRQQKQG